MFSKEESALLRKDFWTSFGKSFPRKWLLYNTKIKGFSFKFVAERKQAMVCLDIENPDELVNLLYYDQMLSLKTLLETELPEVIFNDEFELESGKIIHRIYVPFEGKFSVYNKNSWRDCFEFYMETMPKFELFFYEYEDIIKNI
ncbi:MULTISPECIES: DUF4268 domain-containing protein [Polaribacter]|uniref:DUF4268 domain-containing protein n=1 Tax=Polaribacter sejongensis TaxID=985043 RepID=A0AAJ1VGQ4_9FLAO|nr:MULTISPECIES: DUF4268 domain-containing protein [Polaribacter]AUC23436.1 hypothetical protein BTO15_15590 [Polaribacter sejongensis]MDN3619539.1 DUF4268 domain-containing protein [Polaribacter undariae]UWD32346.1 DUF4268 domain-containing protein [Polaribacter undariae]